MLYTILRPTTRIVLQGYYKKIFVNGQHRIPKDQPVILAVNHPSAFTEPCVLATHLDRELHFLIRGDIINPKVKWFFDQTNQLPIYRFQDGFSSMRQNEKQFSYCFDLLANSGCIVIFAEGSTQHIKQTRPIQKGAARIAFGALENRDLEDVWIVPVGVNFEYSPRPRSIITVEIGEPISTRAYYPAFKEDERRGLKEITREIYKGLKPQMINIHENERMDLADDLMLFASNDMNYKTFPVAEYESSAYFDHVDATAKSIDQMTDSEWSEVSGWIKTYKEKLSAAGVKDLGVPASNKSKLWWILSTPLALAGWAFLGPVFWLSFNLQGRLNKKAEYISGFRMAGFLLFVPIFILIWMILFASSLGWWVISFTVVLPVLSMVAIWWLDALKDWQNLRLWDSLPPEKRQELKKLREQIMGQITPKV